MVTLEIHNIKTRLSGDMRVLNKLYKELSFRHPNAYHIRQNIKFDWDGMVHPLTDAGYIKTGLLEVVVDKLMALGVEEFEVIDHRVYPEFTGVPEKVGAFQLRDYQKEALAILGNREVLGFPHYRGLFIQSMNAGKTLELFATHMMFEDARTLLIISSKIIYKQLLKDAKEVFDDQEVGFMQGKNLKWGNLMIVMAQTLKNRLKEFREELLEYNIMAIDEADLSSNKIFQEIFTSLSHIAIRVGFTGTAFLRQLKKDALKNIALVENFGETLHKVSMKELEDWGHSTPVTIKLIKPPYTRVGKQWLEEFKDVITFNPDTHKLVLRRIKYNQRRGNKHILVVCKFIEQTEILYEFLKDKVGTTIDYTHHKRTAPVESFKVGDTKILITALYLKRGVNLPLINTIISVADGDWYSNPIQVIGRGTRKHGSKQDFYYEDILFMGKYLSPHSRQRVKYYKNLGVKLRDYS